MMKPDFERVNKLLNDTILLLCKNGLTYNQELHIQGLLGITIDASEVFLVSINEHCSSVGIPSSSAVSSSGRESASLEREPPRKRSREDIVDLTRLAETPDVRSLSSSQLVTNSSLAPINQNHRPSSAGTQHSLNNMASARPQHPGSRMQPPPPHVSPRSHLGTGPCGNQRQVVSTVNRGGSSFEPHSMASPDSSRILIEQRLEQEQQMIIANSLQRLAGRADNNLLKQKAIHQGIHQQQQQQQQLTLQQQQAMQKQQVQQQQHVQQQALHQHQQALRQQQQQQQALHHQQHAVQQQQQQQALHQQQKPNAMQQQHHMMHQQQEIIMQHQLAQQQQLRQQQLPPLHKQYHNVRQQQPKQGIYSPQYDSCHTSNQPNPSRASHQPPPSLALMSLNQMCGTFPSGGTSRVTAPHSLQQMCSPSAMDPNRLGQMTHSPRLALPAPPISFDHSGTQNARDVTHQHRVMEDSLFGVTHMPDVSIGEFSARGSSNFHSRMQVPCITPADRILAAYHPANQHLTHTVVEAPLHAGPENMRASSSAPALAVVKLSPSPTRVTHRARPRVEHIDLCGDDNSLDGSAEPNSSLPILSSILIQPDGIDIGLEQGLEFMSHDMESTNIQPTDCSNSENISSATDYDLPPAGSIREILPQMSEGEEENNEENTSQSGVDMNQGEVVDSSCAAGFSDSGRSSGSAHLDEMRFDSHIGSMDQFDLPTPAVDSEVEGSRLSADESQAIVELYFNSEMNELRCEPSTDVNSDV